MNRARSTRAGVTTLAATVAGFVCVGVGAGLALSHRHVGGAARIGRGVVVIDTNLGYQNAAAAGTGMVLSSSGEVLTNNHVIKGATNIRIVVPSTGRSYPAKVVGYDISADVALLQAQGASSLKTIPLGDSSKVSVGQAATALGNAGGTGSLTAATGAITGLGKTITASDQGSNGQVLHNLIETNANVQPGDSGGPLLDKGGLAIGMDTAGSAASPYAAETSPDAYAVPINDALAIVRQIESGNGSATIHVGGTPFLGVQLESADDGYGYGSSSAGAMIAAVVPNQPAASAGLEAGDTVTAIDGREITSPSDVSDVLLTKNAGASITVAYTDSSGTSQETTVTLASGPAQ